MLQFFSILLSSASLWTRLLRWKWLSNALHVHIASAGNIDQQTEAIKLSSYLLQLACSVLDQKSDKTVQRVTLCCDDRTTPGHRGHRFDLSIVLHRNGSSNNVDRGDDSAVCGLAGLPCRRRVGGGRRWKSGRRSASGPAVFTNTSAPMHDICPPGTCPAAKSSSQTSAPYT